MTSLGGIRQIGFVVANAVEAAERWIAAGAAGPFFLMREARFPNWQFRGASQDLVLDISFAQSGDVMIEFIEPKGAWPNVYGERAPAAGTILPHHHAYLVPNLDAAAAVLGGREPLTTADVSDHAALRYYDMRDTLGTIVELITDCPQTRAFFDLARDAATGWDGRDPIRPIGLT